MRRKAPFFPTVRAFQAFAIAYYYEKRALLLLPPSSEEKESEKKPEVLFLKPKIPIEVEHRISHNMVHY